MRSIYTQQRDFTTKIDFFSQLENKQALSNKIFFLNPEKRIAKY